MASSNGSGADGARVARTYQRLGAGYDRISSLLDRTAVNRMRAPLIGRASGDVLEIAVGTGANLRHYPAGTRLTGLDFAARAVDAATKRASTLDLDWTPLVGDAQRIPLPAASFDTVVCTLAACTFADPAAVVAEIRRVLRPEGQALFLEHVRAESATGRVLLRAVKPLTVAALGCHPDRDTVRTIAEAGFEPTILDRAAGGLFLTVSARPQT